MAHRAGPPRVEDGHHVLAAAERRERVAAADDLAQGRQVGPHAVALLGTTVRDPERDDLVEDQQGAHALGERSQPVEEAGLGRADATGTLDGFDDDRGEVALAAAQDGFDAVRVAPRQLG